MRPKASQTPGFPGEHAGGSSPPKPFPVFCYKAVIHICLQPRGKQVCFCRKKQRGEKAPAHRCCQSPAVGARKEPHRLTPVFPTDFFPSGRSFAPEEKNKKTKKKEGELPQKNRSREAHIGPVPTVCGTYGSSKNHRANVLPAAIPSECHRLFFSPSVAQNAAVSELSLWTTSP